MKRKNLILIASLAVLICFSVSSAPAQQQPSAPVSSGASQSGAPASGGSQNGAVPAANGVSAPDSRNIDFVSQAEPDTRPLTGAELYSLGSLGKPRDVFRSIIFRDRIGHPHSNDTRFGTVVVDYDSGCQPERESPMDPFPIGRLLQRRWQLR